MRFFFSKILFFFFILINFAGANNNVKFVDINYIVNNSISGKNLNQMIEDKNKIISNDLKKLGKQLEEKKNKIMSQKNILKKEELENLVKTYENEVSKFNEIRKKKNR